MRRIIVSLILFLGTVFVASTVSASPKLQYKFSTLSYGTNCGTNGSLPCAQDYSGYRSSLDAMSVTLEQIALSNGTASLSIQQNGIYSPANIVNDGIASLALALYPLPPTSIALSEAAYLVNGGFYYFNLGMQVNVGTKLTGLIHINDGNSEIGFGMNPSSLANLIDPTLLLPTIASSDWTGFIRSDALVSDVLFFTGEWRFAGVVSEPETIYLMLFAVAGMLLNVGKKSKRWGPKG